MSMTTKILLRPESDRFFITVHAAPHMQGTFQWYYTDAFYELPETDIDWATSEDITLTSEDIKEHYMGKWLACRCKFNGEIYTSGHVYLTDSFIEMIRCQQIDRISFLDEGNQICYGPR